MPDAKFELQIGGVWTEAPVRMASRITHSRGRRSQGARVDAAVVNLTLESPDGLYNNRNPLSPNFGLLGRNTPGRLTVDGGTPFLDVTTGTSGASTPDAAALDITGDIDIRFEATLSNWLKSGGVSASVELCGKGDQIGNQRSWLLLMRDRRLHFEWSAAGTTTIEKESTADLPVPPWGHIAVRVTLDVNNGAAGNTVTFYTSDSISGPWTQLGDPVITAGTTSIFSSTASVRVGDGWSDLTFEPAAGRIHAFELRNGIAGSAVANPDFSAATPGASTLVDGTGKTWTLFGSGVFTSRRVRCLPEVSKWPPKWHVSGHNQTVPIQASGIFQRLERGRRALKSTLTRRITTTAGVLAYWPMEDSEGSSRFASPLPNVLPMTFSGFDLAANADLDGSKPLPNVQTGGDLNGIVPAGTVSNQFHIEFIYFLPSAPASEATLLRYVSQGTVRTWHINLSSTQVIVYGFDPDGTLVSSVTQSLPSTAFNDWNRISVFADQNGGNVDWFVRLSNIAGTGIALGTSYAGTVGRITSVTGPPSNYSSTVNGMTLGHIAVFQESDTFAFNFADHGFTGETAGDRVVRLATEENVPYLVSGIVAEQMQMGPQHPEQLLTLLGECEDADGGILYEERDRLAIAYRGRATLYNQPPVLTLDYGQITQPFEPVEDDDARNDWTVTREGGSSARVTVDDGPLSVQDPPNGIGLYEAAVTLNLADDDQPQQIAGWLAHLSTWDEARYPRIRILLHKAPELIPQMTDLDVGDVVRITGTPSFLPPGPYDLMVEGYEEEFGEFEWTVVLVCSPAGPWTVGVVDDADARADTDGSELAAAATDSDTVLSVTTTAGEAWTTHPDDFPLQARVGGEVVTVNAITGQVQDTFSRTTTGGWGTATSGHAWTTSGGTGTDYSVQGA
ncbi:hypothetical protein HRW18_05405 [Streptomyces lunaelactis]|uniref:hypothetical protein n=1 Tax=Streptomyces lunaelactis TaxID=1535768 RepID=UPI001584CB82|nr:hypothetical protein [Streptomyces lunaelactis]NUK07459.1 hypothetical protein [Streptomyces lunaelactis]